MNYQLNLKPDLPVGLIPAPREKVRLLMVATSVAIGGLIDTAPGQSNPGLANCLYLNRAGVILMGTACRRPLMLREAVDVSAAADEDVLVVRYDERDAHATFDLKRAGVPGIMCAYRMWMPRPSEAAWLIPTIGDGEFVRVTPLGLEVYAEAPFANDWERRAGLARGWQFLSVAVQGWF